MALPLAVTGAAQAATGILAVGDFGVGGPAQGALGEAMRSFEAKRPAEVLVTLGDNDYTESPPAFRRNWRDSFGWLADAGVAVAGTLGNHDVRVDGGRYELGPLGMPRAYYARRVGDVELFLLDSTDVTSAQVAWLRGALARSSARWRIAALHHPAYTCGAYRSHPEVVTRFVPLFERFGVQLVLAAHDHNYQRFAPRRGVTYVVHGGGTPRLYGVEACPAGYPRRVAAKVERGFLHLSAGEGRLRGVAVGLDGAVVDRFDLYP